MDYQRPQARGHDAFKRIYALGGAAALVAASGAVLDIAIGLAAGGGAEAVDAATCLAGLVAAPALGLYRLDLLNLATTLISVPAIYACAIALGRLEGEPAGGGGSGADGAAKGAIAGLAFALAVLGAAVFVAGNPALPMLGLAREWAGAGPERRLLLEASGEAILAHGAHGSPGALPAFALPLLANLVLCGALAGGGAKNRPFPRGTALLGFAGNALLLAYLGLMAFVPALRGAALALAAPGGMAATAWTVMIGIGLLRLARRI